jgi:hypothetical protein
MISELERYAVAGVLQKKEFKPEAFKFEDDKVYASKMFYYKDLEPELSEEIARLEKAQKDESKSKNNAS